MKMTDRLILAASGPIGAERRIIHHELSYILETKQHKAGSF